MKPKFLGLRTVIYKVNDLKKATDWYAKIFETKPYFDEPFYVGFNIGDYELGLVPDDTKESMKSENVMTYWGVANVEKEYDRMLQMGAKEYEKPQSVGGEIVVAAVKDPWNNVVGIIYNPDFKLPQSK